MNKFILTSAQDFGFGPTVRLQKVTKLLKNKIESNNLDIEIHHLANKNYYFFNKDPNFYIGDKITELDKNKKGNYTNNLQDFLLSFNPNNTIGVLCSYDSNLALWAYSNKIKNIFTIDGLFPFWKIDESLKSLKLEKRKIQEAAKISLKNVYKLLNKYYQNNQPHKAIFSLYYISTHNFIQNFPGVLNRLDLLDKAGIKNETYKFGAMTSKHKLTKTRDSILVQFNGVNYPILDQEDEKNYIKLILKIFDHLSRKYFTEKKWIVVCPKKIVGGPCNELINQSKGQALKNLIFKDTLLPNQNLSLIAKSFLYFSAPGTNSIYESAFCRTPLFLLPDKHGSQSFAFTKLTEAGYYAPGAIISELFPIRQKYNDEYEITKEMYRFIAKSLKNEKVFRKFLKPFECFLQKVKDKDYYDNLAKRQHLSIKDILNGFSGNEEISEQIFDILTN
jgi:hypothetical protein